MKKIDYPCRANCALCCRNDNPKMAVDAIQDLINDGLDVDPSLTEFPYKLINGSCENITKDNLCKVYNNRPKICQLQTSAEMLGIPVVEMFIANMKECNKVIERSGRKDEIGLIDIEDWTRVKAQSKE